MVSPKIFFRRYIYNNSVNIDTLMCHIVYDICNTGIYEVNAQEYDSNNKIITIELINADNTPVAEFYPIINKAFSKFINENNVKTGINIGLKDLEGDKEYEQYKEAIQTITSGSVYLLYGATKAGKYLHIYI